MGEIKTETEKDINKEQEELLEFLETEFKDRYTEADKEFKIVWENDTPPPPIFVDWETRYENRRNSTYRRGYKDYPRRDFRLRRYGVNDRPGRRTYKPNYSSV